MDFLNRMNKVIDYIENNLDGEISNLMIAKISCCPLHQFGRIFTYVVSIPLSEYIRRRRLTQAAYDLQSGRDKVIEVALRYGYDSPNSFRRAFIEMHGLTPSEARTRGVILKSYPRLSFHISIKGDVEMNYRIEERELVLVGIRRNNITPDEYGKVWDEFLDEKMPRHGKTPNEIIRDDLCLYRPPVEQMGVYMMNDDGTFDLVIGAESDGREIDIEGIDVIRIPVKTWAAFKTAPGGFVDELGELHLRVLSDWLPTSGYKQDKLITAQVFPMDTTIDVPTYQPELWIAITKE
jgi:AraC family transcriptional regulator